MIQPGQPKVGEAGAQIGLGKLSPEMRQADIRTDDIVSPAGIPSVRPSKV
jgi:hypothetical protein